MLTANEIQNTQFSKSMGGYKTAEVDEFKYRCAKTVMELTAAKTELEKKLEVLADKLVEYRNDEDNIRTALLSAQRLGDTVLREAKHKAGLIMDDAKIKAEKIQENAQKSIRDEEREFERIRKEITNFKARMLSIYREHLSLIDVLPEVKNEQPAEETPQAAQPEEAPAQEPAVPEQAALEVPKKETEPAFEPVEEIYAPQEAVVPLTPSVLFDIPELPDEEDDDMVKADAAGDGPISRFRDLKFGDDYDISKDGDKVSPGLFKKQK